LVSEKAGYYLKNSQSKNQLEERLKVVECLPSKCEAISSNPVMDRERERERELNINLSKVKKKNHKRSCEENHNQQEKKKTLPLAEILKVRWGSSRL
jgi:hypothetical protein